MTACLCAACSRGVCVEQDLSSQYFRQFKPNNAPAMPSTTPLPVKVRRRRYPHATAAAELGSQPVPKPEDLER